MKILLTVLLVAAIGAGVYYFVIKKDKPVQQINRELIIGKWKLDNLQVHPKDSGSLFAALFYALTSDSAGYFAEFSKDGRVISGTPGEKADTVLYEWNAKSQLELKTQATDSTSQLISILKLNTDSLVMLDKDSTRLHFLKVK